MDDASHDQLSAIKSRLRTRKFSANGLGQVVRAMQRLGVHVFALQDTTGAWSLGTGSVVSVIHDCFTLEFERLRGLTPTEVETVKSYGVGIFAAPAQQEIVRWGDVQDST